jgi:hypothetical protein
MTTIQPPTKPAVPTAADPQTERIPSAWDPPKFKTCRAGVLVRRAELGGLVAWGFLSDMDADEAAESNIVYATFDGSQIHAIQRALDQTLNLGMRCRGLACNGRLQWLFKPDEVRPLKIEIDAEQLSNRETRLKAAEALFLKREAIAKALLAESKLGEPKPSWLPAWVA